MAKAVRKSNKAAAALQACTLDVAAHSAASRAAQVRDVVMTGGSHGSPITHALRWPFFPTIGGDATAGSGKNSNGRIRTGGDCAAGALRGALRDQRRQSCVDYAVEADL